MMIDAERKDNARKRLEAVLSKGTTVYTTRIDYGRNSTLKHYYAVFVMVDGRLDNISGHVARLIGCKWSNEVNGNDWANSSGVLFRNESDLVMQLAHELFGIYTVREIEETLPHISV